MASAFESLSFRPALDRDTGERVQIAVVPGKPITDRERKSKKPAVTARGIRAWSGDVVVAAGLSTAGREALAVARREKRAADRARQAFAKPLEAVRKETGEAARKLRGLRERHLRAEQHDTHLAGEARRAELAERELKRQLAGWYFVVGADEAAVRFDPITAREKKRSKKRATKGG